MIHLELSVAREMRFYTWLVFNRIGLCGEPGADLSVHRGGTVFPSVGNLSAVVPFVSRSRMTVCAEEVYSRFARAGSLIKHDGLPAALQEKSAASNANGIADSAASITGNVGHSTWLALKIRFGRGLWKRLHRMADAWPCRRCRPQMTVWMQGLHDAVNARLGRPVFLPESYAQYSSGSLEGKFHPGCVGCRMARTGSRFLARAPTPDVRRLSRDP
jgi:hypothetical protein